MRRFYVFSLLCVLSLAFFNQSSRAETLNQGIIRGIVVNPQGYPLANVKISLYQGNNGYMDVASTASDGTYTINNLSANNYKVHFHAPSSMLADEYYDNQPTRETANYVMVTSLGVSIADAQLDYAGQIRGKATASDTGLPLANVTISLYTANNNYYGSVVSNSAGEYTLPPVVEGTYKLFFSSPTPYLNKQDVVAQVVIGQITTINVSLDRGSMVHGHVVADDTNQPLSNVSVILFNASSGPNYGASTNADGYYVFPEAIAAGTYTLNFNPGWTSDYFEEYYDNQPSSDTATSIQIGSTGIYTFNVGLERGVNITAQITAQDTGLPLQSVAVYAYHNYQIVDSASTNAAGIAQLVVHPDNYKLQIQPTPNAPSGYLAEYYDNQATLESATVISASSPLDPITITAELERGTVFTGRITASDTGLSIDRVKVYVLNEEGNLRALADSDSTGHYTSTAVPSGKYRLQFTPYWSGYKTEYYSNTTNPFSATLFTVPMSDTFAINADAVLDRGNQFTGKVTAKEGGYPLADVDVYVYSRRDSNPYNLSYRAHGYTDATGTFTTTHGLEACTYYLEFKPYEEGASRYFISEFYNHKTEWNATPIQITSESGMYTVNTELRTSLHSYLPLLWR